MSTKPKKYDVVALGSCTMDMIFSVNDIMRMELTDASGIEKKYAAIEYSTKVNVKKVQFFPGGSAANIACDLAGIGLNTAYIGGIGRESAGEICMSDMISHGVDTSGVKQFDDEVTAHSIILITPLGRDRSILAYKGANDLFTKDHVNPEMLKNTRCFAWTSLTSDQGIEAIQHCITLGRAYGALIAGAPSISIIKKRLKDSVALLKQSDITSMNEEEITALTGEKDIHAAMQILLDWGLKYVNVTMGKDGAWITTKDSKKLVKTTPPKIVVSDTTGAGDATMSGLIYGALNNIEISKIAKLSASMSAMEIEGTGVRIGTPKSMVELDTFIGTHDIQQKISDF